MKFKFAVVHMAKCTNKGFFIYLFIDSYLDIYLFKVTCSNFQNEIFSNFSI